MILMGKFLYRVLNMACLMQYLFFSIVFGSATGFRRQNVCSSSCGVQTIKFPFRLNGDPTFCGHPDFELICMGNRTIMELNHGTYYVAAISYEATFIHFVDANMASGRCCLPFGLPYVRKHQYIIKQFSLLSLKFASFVNCSEEIQEYSYQRVPCLSGNGSFIYVAFDYKVAALSPSCTFLSMVPMSSYNYEAASPRADIFQLLKRGFYLTWLPVSFTSSQLINICLSDATEKIKEDGYGDKMRRVLDHPLYPILVDNNFLMCLYSYKHYRHISPVSYGLAVFCVVSLNIAAILLGIAVLVRLILAPLCIVVFLAYECPKMMAPIDTVEKFLRDQQALAPTRYTYTDIVAITRHFKEKIGHGGFGSVFKGELPGGHLVAVKMLGSSKCNGEDFINEVSTIGRIRHLNVVRLVGFCSEGSKRGLVYEFMSNGSLDKHIFSSNGSRNHFTVEKLNEIALGVAKGIDYLHCGCDMRILHFDIKPNNILLDHNFNPKVSDFGLAKLYPKDYSLVSISAARGTIGYIAPELVSRSFGAISHKSDVYSFGMLLLEMAGRRRNVVHGAENSSQVYYPSWIYDRLLQSERPEICSSIEIDDMEKKLSKIGLWCIQVRPSHRPSMSRVIEMLEDDEDKLRMPPKPFLSTPEPVYLSQHYMDSSAAELSVISEDE